MEGKVLGAVDRERKRRWISTQDRSGPVPLVYVGVDDDHPLNEPRGLDGAGGDGRVVEDTISLTFVGERVVRPPCEVRGKTFLDGGETGSQRAARGAAGALHHPLRPREPDAPHLLVRERSGSDALQVAGGVGAQDLLVCYCARNPELSRT